MGTPGPVFKQLIAMDEPVRYPSISLPPSFHFRNENELSCLKHDLVVCWARESLKDVTYVTLIDSSFHLFIGWFRSQLDTSFLGF
jgi:hypothetical protein